MGLDSKLCTRALPRGVPVLALSLLPAFLLCAIFRAGPFALEAHVRLVP